MKNEIILTKGPIHKEPYTEEHEVDAPWPDRLGKDEFVFLAVEGYIDGNKKGGWYWTIEWVAINEWKQYARNAV